MLHAPYIAHIGCLASFTEFLFHTPSTKRFELMLPLRVIAVCLELP